VTWVIVMPDARDTAKSVLSLRVNLAVQNMLAAARFSRRVAELEESHRGQKFGDFWDEILHNSSASIMCCSSSLEAYANELFFNRGTVFPKYSTPLLDSLWGTYERKQTLQKFEFALLLSEKPKFDKGQPHIEMLKLSSIYETLSSTSSRNGILKPTDT
jgi:hypothetical protein